MFKKFPKRFSKTARFVVLISTSLFAIIAIAIGGIYGIGNPNDFNKSNHYGRSAQVLVDIKAKNTTTQITQSLADQIAKDVNSRINVLNLESPTINVEKHTIGNTTNYRLRITAADVKNIDEKDELRDLISVQPILSFYGTDDKPVFNQTGYNSSKVDVPDDQQLQLFKPGSAAAAIDRQSSNQSWKVDLDFTGTSAQIAFANATQGISSDQNGDKTMITWLSHDILKKEVQARDPNGLAAVQNNLFSYIHVSGKGPDGTDLSPTLKEEQYHASNYFITQQQFTSQPSLSDTFTLRGNFTKSTAQALAARINYGMTNYTLDVVYDSFTQPSYGTNAFRDFLIAGIVGLALVALFLIVNYGLLGVLSTISLALYISLSLIMFTVMRGEYSPQTVGALMLGVGVAVNSNILTFERLKDEIYQGYSVSKSIVKSNRVVLASIFDANLVMLVIAFVLFFFGIQMVKGFSILLIILVVISFLVIAFFTRLLASVLVRSGVFEKRSKWLGVYWTKNIPVDYQQPVVPKYKRINYVKHSKWYAIASAILVGAGVVVYATMAGINGSFVGGFNVANSLKGAERITFTKTNEDEPFLDPERNALFEEINKLGITYNIQEMYDADETQDSNPDILVGIVIESSSQNLAKLDAALPTILTHLNSINGSATAPGQVTLGQLSQYTNPLGADTVRNAIAAIAIALAIVIAYILIRFGWTYGFAVLVAFVHDGLIITAVFILGRVPVDTSVVVGLLVFFGYSLENKIVAFTRIRELMSERKLNEVYSKETLQKIVNKALGDTIKTSVLILCGFVLLLVPYAIFWGAISVGLFVAIAAGIFIASYSTLFIAFMVWILFENYRHKRIVVRKNKDFWKTKGYEEQTIESINDFHV